MRDRTPAPGKANRVKITQDDGTVVEGVLAYADDATQEGSAYTKGNVLPDDVCGILGIDPVTSEPKDAWFGVIQALGYSILTITVLQYDGTPLSNFKVEGLTGVIDEKCYTDSNGKIFLIIQEGDYSLSIPSAECIDSKFNTQSVTVNAGENQNITMQAVSNGTSVSYTTSKSNLQFSGSVATVSVFCCGGGGGGGGGYYANDYDSAGGGGGGGGGYTTTAKNVSFTPYTKFNVTVGSGGSGGAGKPGTGNQSSAIPRNGNSGGTSSALNVTAFGGQGGYSSWDDIAGDNMSRGGNGGSGGGGGKLGYSSAGNTGGDGGRDGSNGTSPSGAASGGTGQGTSTRSLLNVLCSGGGGGGGMNNGSNGSGSTGMGGRGGTSAVSSYDRDGFDGADGLVELVWEFK